MLSLSREQIPHPSPRPNVRNEPVNDSGGSAGYGAKAPSIISRELALDRDAPARANSRGVPRRARAGLREEQLLRSSGINPRNAGAAAAAAAAAEGGRRQKITKPSLSCFGRRDKIYDFFVRSTWKNKKEKAEKKNKRAEDLPGSRG